MKELSLHILDIAQNSVRANASKIIINISENIKKNIFQFSIKDNGSGIESDIFKNIKNPFTTTRTTRKVGLGIPFLNDTCRLCNGNLLIETEIGKGTYLEATMEYNNIDRPPLGNIVSTVVGLVISNEKIHFVYIHKYNEKTFEFDVNTIKEILDGIPLTDFKVIEWLENYLTENVIQLKIK